MGRGALSMDGETGPATEHPPRAILVVDDHPLFCEALSLALRAGLPADAVHTASSLGEGMRLLVEGLEAVSYTHLTLPTKA
jgi:DNA-binding NarL/FixJ family response regulator